MLEDAEIIRRCKQGQPGLLDILIDRYRIDLYSLCVRLTRSKPDADDLFQDTWVRVMKRMQSYSAGYEFKTWLFSICLNRYRDIYRRRMRWAWWRRPGRVGGTDEIDTIESPSPSPEAELLGEESRRAVKSAVDSLEDTYRVPMVLFYFQNCPVAEIGTMLDIPAGTVKSRLHKGRALVKAALEEAGHER